MEEGEKGDRDVVGFVGWTAYRMSVDPLKSF